MIWEYELNQIYCEDCVSAMKKIPDNSVDMIITSPPYDDLRDYNWFKLDLHGVGNEGLRILKEWGIFAMVIQDSTKDFWKSLTTFRTIVDWVDNVWFKLFECTIYRKHWTEWARRTQRFRVDHEYMPIFLKWKKPQYFNKEPLKIPSKHWWKTMTWSWNRKTNWETTETVTREINPTKCRWTVRDYLMAWDKNPLKRKHPAVFPDAIPKDFIQCFCPEWWIVLDPYMWSWSTLVVAKQLWRNYIWFDISQEYVDLANERIRKECGWLF